MKQAEEKAKATNTAAEEKETNAKAGVRAAEAAKDAADEEEATAADKRHETKEVAKSASQKAAEAKEDAEAYERVQQLKRDIQRKKKELIQARQAVKRKQPGD